VPKSFTQYAPPKYKRGAGGVGGAPIDRGDLAERDVPACVHGNRSIAMIEASCKKESPA
jgi:hypothetical protein